jgi:hypothetical protein
MIDGRAREANGKLVRSAKTMRSLIVASLALLTAAGAFAQANPAALAARDSHDSVVMGNANQSRISAGCEEMRNLAMRMGVRGFTRLADAFSGGVGNHPYQVALHFMDYNFARIHGTVRVAPAVETGILDRGWSLEEIALLAG